MRKVYHLCFWKGIVGTGPNGGGSGGTGGGDDSNEICPKCGKKLSECICEAAYDSLLGIETPINFTFIRELSWNGEILTPPEDYGWHPYQKLTGTMLLKNASDEQNILRDESTGKIIAIRNEFVLTGEYESTESDIDGSYPVSGQFSDNLIFSNSGFKLTKYWNGLAPVERRELTTEEWLKENAGGQIMVTVDASNNLWDSILFATDSLWINYDKFLAITASSSFSQTFVEQDGAIDDDGKVYWWDEGGDNTVGWPFVGPTNGPLRMTTTKTVQFQSSSISAV